MARGRYGLRKIGGKIFRYSENVATKKVAGEISETYRKQGWLARIISRTPIGHKKPASYDVYVHYTTSKEKQKQRSHEKDLGR